MARRVPAVLLIVLFGLVALSSASALFASPDQTFAVTPVPAGTVRAGTPVPPTGAPRVSLTAPSTPTGLKATAGNQQITLMWNPNSETDTWYYKIYWKTSGSFSWLDSTIHPATTFVKTGLTNGVTYSFEVSAVNKSKQEGGLSGPVSVAPVAPTVAPAIPTGLTAAGGNQQVTLNWNANPEPDVKYYKVYWSLNSVGPFSWNRSVLAPATSLVRTGLVNGATYYFKISAVNSTGRESGQTNAVTAKPAGAPSGTPAIPTGLTAVAGNQQIALTWNRNAETNIRYYKIYWSRNPAGPFSWYDSVMQPTTTYVRTGLVSGIANYIKIAAVNTNGLESGQTAYVAAAPTAPPTPTPNPNIPPPSAPTGLRAQVGDRQVTLSWNPNPESNMWAYRVYSSLNPNGPYTWNSGTAHPTTSFTKTGLTSGGTYYFKLVAVNSGGRERAQTGPVTVMSAPGLRFAQDDAFRVQYPVNGNNWVSYVLNRQTVGGPDGKYEQFVPSISVNGSPISTVPYVNGISGLVMLSFNVVPPESTPLLVPPHMSGVVETLSAKQVTIRYTNLEAKGGVGVGNFSARFIYQSGYPFLQINNQFTPSTTVTSKLSYNVWPAMGGSYNHNNRVVVPYDNSSYYVINGQALGIHYFPRTRPWSLRMGAEWTSYRNVTTGWFYANPQEARLLDNGWAMGHDYCRPPNEGAGLENDVVPYGLETVFDNLYIIYQEDEAGHCDLAGRLNYAWQSADSPAVTVKEGQSFQWRVFYWAGLDTWDNYKRASDPDPYGKYLDGSYRFNIDYWYQTVKNLLQPIQLPGAQSPVPWSEPGPKR